MHHIDWPTIGFALAGVGCVLVFAVAFVVASRKSPRPDEKEQDEDKFM